LAESCFTQFACCAIENFNGTGPESAGSFNIHPTENSTYEYINRYENTEMFKNPSATNGVW